jgi:hypothetical protein
MYDLSKQPEFTGAGVLPPGEYLSFIEDAEVTRSKAGAPMIKITFEVNGQKIWDYLTLDKQNERSYNIAMSKAKSILTATGCTTFNFRNETDMAHAMNGELMLTLGTKEEEYNGAKKEKNIIKKYSPIPVIHRHQARSKARHDSDSIPF